MPNRTIPVIDVPHSLMPAKTPTDGIRSLIATALAAKLELLICDSTGMERKSIFMPPVLDFKIEAVAAERGWTYQDSVISLVTSALAHVAKQRGSVEEAKTGVNVPFASRPGQDVYYQSIMASLQAGRVCMAEASTGIGKSRAIVAAAIACALEKKRPVVIAAPTLTILGSSLWFEYEKLISTGLGVSPGRTVRARFFPGASEFIDHEALSAYLEEKKSLGEPVDQAVEQWVWDGGRNLVETPLGKAMSLAGRPLTWLLNDLRDLATELDPDDFVLRTDKASPNTRQLLDDVRNDAVEADIIFCTHAMLARAQMSKWSWFPAPSVLFIDEAHLFEGIVANIYSGRLSINSLQHNTRLLKKNSTTKGLVAAAQKLELNLGRLISVIKISDDGIGTSFKLSSTSHNAEILIQALVKVQDALKAKALSKLDNVSEVRTTITDVIIAMTDGINKTARIEYSPDRRFPSILAGKGSVGGVLGSIWKTVQGGVVLASATLSTPDIYGNSKFDYMAGVLALPTSRLDSPNPITAPWVRTIPCLHIPNFPEPISRPPPADRNDLSESVWLRNLAHQVHDVAQKAKGGSMVLMTSYAQVKGLTEHLLDLGLGDRVVAHNPEKKFAESEARFRVSYQEGRKPVLVALGVAWTGVDLTDKNTSTETDFLLTDLIIGCLPIGLNRSSTMNSRIEHQGLEPLKKEALMTLLQGLGRAVRSENAVFKNIWVMDGRIWSNWPSMRTLQQSARKILEKYPNRKKF